jgi:hypothetical protein
MGAQILMKTPSSNIQAPENHQVSSSNSGTRRAVGFGVWDLELRWMLELGIWNF